MKKDFAEGLKRLNEVFYGYNLEQINLSEDQLSRLAAFFIQQSTKITRSGSHYRLEYPGVIIPLFHTPLKPADIYDAWIRLKVISSN